MEYPVDSTANLATKGESVGTKKKIESLVDFGDLELKQLDPDTRKGYAGMIAGAKPAFDWLLGEIIKQQITRWSRNSSEMNHTFHNGGMNMADLILEAIENLTAEHQDNITPKEEVKPTDILSSGSSLDII